MGFERASASPGRSVLPRPLTIGTGSCIKVAVAAPVRPSRGIERAFRTVAGAEMTQVIYFVRHGETVWNLHGRVQGHLDAPLTARGFAEARRDGAALRGQIEADEPYLLVFSPLHRTRETAAVIAEEVGASRLCGRRSDDRLKEVSWGAWDGLTFDQIKARDPEVWQARLGDRWNVAPPGGESYRMLYQRVAAWFASMVDHPRLIVVSHGALGRVLRGAYLQLPPAQILALDEPQDALIRLAAGAATTIPTTGSR
jgi:broad specificity phosphatase PhoE